MSEVHNKDTHNSNSDHAMQTLIPLKTTVAPPHSGATTL